MARRRTQQSFSAEIEELIQTLNHIADNSEEIAKKAIYEGAKILADQIKSNIESLPTDEEWGSSDHLKSGPTAKEKEEIKKGFGLAKMLDSNGFINTKIGFGEAGYDSRGKPVQMIARSVNSGTTFMKRNPFFANGVRQGKGHAEQRMKEILEREIDNLTR